MRILIRDRQRCRRLSKGKINKYSRRILTILNQHNAELSILFVGEKKMTRLNAEHRGIPKSTDVLSFPQACEKNDFPLRIGPLILGDIVICVPRAELQAKINGLEFYDEVRRLLIHGTLHLLGYDHERSPYYEWRMKKKEKELFDATKEMD